jgi:uncharacterized membrane-anchored protein YitT (DUF2179 family)
MEKKQMNPTEQAEPIVQTQKLGLKAFLKKHKIVIKDEIIRFSIIVLSTFVYGIGVAWFLEQSVIPLYSGGITGIGQLTRDAIYVWFNVQLPSWYLSIFIVVANIPIFILGWFGVSKRFTIYSIISIVVQSYALGFLPALDMGLSSPEHALAASAIGGLLIGVGCGTALKFGMSTGGFDIISQYISFKKGVSVGMISLVINVSIAILGGLLVNGHEFKGSVAIGGIVISYTIIRIIISTMATDKVHTAYHYIALQIISCREKEISDYIMKNIVRGVTKLKVTGAYSKEEKSMLYVVITAFELHSLVKEVKKIDPHAFIVSSPVKGIFGNYLNKPIV